MSSYGDQLAYWDEVDAHDFVVDAGEFAVYVGGSLADVRASGRFKVVEDRVVEN